MHRDIDQLTREQIYDLVWQKPLSRLAPEFGLDGLRLANVCRSKGIPCPPLGYWQKLAVGRAPDRIPLLPELRDVHPTAPRRIGRPRVIEVNTPRQDPRQASPEEPVIGPSGRERGAGLDELDRLHPAIQTWLREHKQAQQEREAELKRFARQPWGWAMAPIPSLTERDLYRFRASSTLCHAVEKSGGKTIAAEMRQGTLSFRIEGRELVCKMVEKMTQSGKGPDKDWTAFNQFLKAGLRSTGYLRAAITTWLPSRQPEWTETGQTSMAQLIPLIVGRISTAVVELKEAETRRAEQEARWRREEQERYEQKRRHEREEAQWRGFTEAARAWRERSMLLEFMGEVERRMGEDASAEINGRTLVQWIEWARDRIDRLDPFVRGVPGLFGKL